MYLAPTNPHTLTEEDIGDEDIPKLKQSFTNNEIQILGT